MFSKNISRITCSFVVNMTVPGLLGFWGNMEPKPRCNIWVQNYLYAEIYGEKCQILYMRWKGGENDRT